MTPVHPPTILLVDDDILILELLTARLQAEGYLVQAAGDGEQAYEMIQRKPFDLVVCDVVMPKMDGPSFCRKVRAEGNRTPFLFVTARGQPADIVEVLSAGADDYMVKPFDSSELLARIAAILRRAASAT